MSAPLRALNRFGLGARPGEPRRLSDPRGWLGAQLGSAPSSRPDPAAAERAALEAATREMVSSGAPADVETRRAVLALVAPISRAEIAAAMSERVATERPFVERMVAFWSNHLCVSSAGKPRVAPLAGPYERDAIRPHVLGRFEDMVLASARHPAMLLYLDNDSSIGPGSTAARAVAARRALGLNENYARELLELHTLGVDGGYTQNDVIELARVLTGWGIGSRDADLPQRSRTNGAVGALTFAFRRNRHEPGARTVLGKLYAAGGVDQGEAVIRDLCAHPATARFVATKLVRHFVADEPPARAVDAIATEFARSGGDLKRVAAAVIELPEAWDPIHRKLRSPQDWTAAMLRALDLHEAPANLPRSLAALRQPLWAPPAPKGWGDTRREWADPDSLLNRAELARTVAGRLGRRADPRSLLEVMDVAVGDPVHALLADETIERSERVALALAGPAFQWR